MSARMRSRATVTERAYWRGAPRRSRMRCRATVTEGAKFRVRPGCTASSTPGPGPPPKACVTVQLIRLRGPLILGPYLYTHTQAGGRHAAQPGMIGDARSRGGGQRTKNGPSCQPSCQPRAALGSVGYLLSHFGFLGFSVQHRHSAHAARFTSSMAGARVARPRTVSGLGLESCSNFILVPLSAQPLRGCWVRP